MIQKLLLITGCFLFITGCKQDDQVSSRTFLIPEGYVGWVQVKYDQQLPKKVKNDGNNQVYKVSQNGMTYTDEEHIHEGWATNKYYYVNDNGEQTSLVPGKMVHGPSSGRELAGKTVEYFFIGSADQFHKDEYVPNEYEVN